VAAEEVGNFKSDTLSIFKILNLGFVFFKIWDLDLRVMMMMMIMPLIVMNIGLIHTQKLTDKVVVLRVYEIFFI
jgi:hypothetical protein